MATARIEVISPADVLKSLPLTIEQRTSPNSAAIAGAFIAVAAALLLAPFGVLAAHAAVDPAAVFATLRNPATALQLGIGLLFGLAFVAVPLRKLLRGTLQPRRIVVSRHTVSAGNGDAGMEAVWSEPLASYEGVAHHIRTSLSGAQHEIVLVHARASRTVVLATADRISQPQVAAMAALLNVAQVPARQLYERKRAQPSNRPRAMELKAA